MRFEPASFLLNLETNAMVPVDVPARLFTFKQGGPREKVSLVGFQETQGGGGGVHGACLPDTGVWSVFLRGDPPPCWESRLAVVTWETAPHTGKRPRGKRVHGKQLICLGELRGLLGRGTTSLQLPEPHTSFLLRLLLHFGQVPTPLRSSASPSP